jgi:uncharacterized protein YxeA
MQKFTEGLKNNQLISSITSNPMIMQAIKLVVILAVVIVVMVLLRKLVFYTMNVKHDQPWLIKGTKDAKDSSIITQDPKNENSVTLYRSDGQDGGAQFSYSFWFVIRNMQYKYGEWKHMFHKGNKTSYPNRAPGVFIHDKENAIRIYMNTYDNPLEYVQIDNIPIKRWVHMVIVLEGQYLDIYVNGYLRKRHKLSSMAKQNFGDVWLNLFGGFEGYMSNLRYYRRALKYDEVEDITRSGPSKEACGTTGEKPPYLDNEWWFDI